MIKRKFLSNERHLEGVLLLFCARLCVSDSFLDVGSPICIPGGDRKQSSPIRVSKPYFRWWKIIKMLVFAALDFADLKSTVHEARLYEKGKAWSVVSEHEVSHPWKVLLPTADIDRLTQSRTHRRQTRSTWASIGHVGDSRAVPYWILSRFWPKYHNSTDFDSILLHPYQWFNLELYTEVWEVRNLWATNFPLVNGSRAYERRVWGEFSDRKNCVFAAGNTNLHLKKFRLKWHSRM